jgi:hypothetical protein
MCVVCATQLCEAFEAIEDPGTRSLLSSGASSVGARSCVSPWWPAVVLLSVKDGGGGMVGVGGVCMSGLSALGVWLACRMDSVAGRTTLRVCVCGADGDATPLCM